MYTFPQKGQSVASAICGGDHRNQTRDLRVMGQPAPVYSAVHWTRFKVTGILWAERHFESDICRHTLCTEQRSSWVGSRGVVIEMREKVNTTGIFLLIRLEPMETQRRDFLMSWCSYYPRYFHPDTIPLTRFSSHLRGCSNRELSTRENGDTVMILFRRY